MAAATAGHLACSAVMLLETTKYPPAGMVVPVAKLNVMPLLKLQPLSETGAVLRL